MTSFKTIPLTQIAIGERARPVDEEHAAAIAASMVDRGLINPITVRHAPNMGKGETPYILIAGGHRLRAAQMNGWEEIDALQVTADAQEAQLMEIAENLYRNELTALDRAIFVMKYREIYEEKHGEIDRTKNLRKGNKSPKCNDCTSDIFSPGRELSERVQERLGFGRRTYFNVTRIGLNLHPSLRSAVRGTKAETDQSKLLKLSKLSADDQIKLAAALRENPDFDAAMALLRAPKEEVDPQEKLLTRMLRDWELASEETRAEFLDQIGLGDGPDALMAEIRSAAA